MANAANADIERFIPFKQVQEALNVGCHKTMKRILARHNIPLTELSRSNRGLMRSNFDLLVARASGRQ